MGRFSVSVVMIVEDDSEDMAEAEVEAQLSDLVSHSSTSIMEFEIRNVKEAEYESEDDL